MESENMSKPEWGIKRICPSCNMKYYDFDKSPIKCPGCGFEFDPDLLLKSRKGRGFLNKAEETISNKIVSEASEEKNIDVGEDLEIEDNDSDVLEIDKESSIDSETTKDLDDEDEKVLGSDLEGDLENNIEAEEEDLPFIDEDLDDEVSVEVEDEENKN
tara:strand:+ start:326 stop:802 length:477 start_codon:yes stop_codon:yes gene_type:complete